MPKLGHVLVDTTLAGALAAPLRILMIDQEDGSAIVMPLRRQSPNGRSIYYLQHPRSMRLSAIGELIDQGAIREAAFDVPALWGVSDADYVSAAANQKDADDRKNRLKKRDEFFESIEPYISNLSIQGVIRSFNSVIAQIGKDSPTKGAAQQIIRRLCLYILSLGRRNSLIPLTSRCGAPGRERTVVRPTGRPKQNTQAKNYVMTQSDKERCAIAMQLCDAGKSLSEAFAIAKNAYWSDASTDEKGRVTHKLWDVSRRPTLDQFAYWGRRTSANVKLKTFGDFNREAPTSRGGSSADKAHAVGVLMELDSTSADVYLVSVESRNRTLPPMHRYIVKCPVTKAVLGFHLDWEAPSPRIALRAVLSAAEDKKALCERFGVECEVDQWPGILASSYLVDNGEFKASEITDAEKEFGFAVEYTRAYSGESKPNVESQHKSDHLRLDHKLSGTTRGRQKKRGEETPASRALLNYWEFMQLALKHYLRWNDELVPDCAPVAMIAAGLSPTRINVFKWFRDTHQIKQKHVDLEHLRCFTLPSWPAVLKEDGIHLLSQDRRRILSFVRYYSAKLWDDDRFQKIRAKRRSLRIDIRIDSSNIEQIYVPLSEGMCIVPNVTAIDQERTMCGLADLIESTHSWNEKRHQSRQMREQAEASDVLERHQIESDARREKRAESAKRSKGPGRSHRDGTSLAERAREESAKVIAQSKASVSRALSKKEATTIESPGDERFVDAPTPEAAIVSRFLLDMRQKKSL